GRRHVDDAGGGAHLRREALSDSGNSVHPGYIMSPMAHDDARQAGLTVEEYLRDFIAKHPIGHLGEPIDIAQGMLYLASDESKFVTGTQLAIDGGYTAVIRR